MFCCFWGFKGNLLKTMTYNLISFNECKNGRFYLKFYILFTILYIITRVRWVSFLLPFQVIKEFFCYDSEYCVMSIFLCYKVNRVKNPFTPCLYTDFRINRQIYLKIDDESPYFFCFKPFSCMPACF